MNNAWQTYEYFAVLSLTQSEKADFIRQDTPSPECRSLEIQVRDKEAHPRVLLSC
jgi:hypothetical protein